MPRKKSKLPELLALIDRREVPMLRKYLASPYFNENQRLPDLLEFSLKHGAVGPEDVWSHLFPNQPYDDLKLRHLRSELMRQIEGFMAHRELRKRESLQKAYLLRGLRRRKAGKMYEFTWRKVQRRAQSSPTSGDLLLEAYLLQSEHNTWLEHRSQRSGETHLQATMDSLDTFYLFSKLKYSCTILNNREVVEVDYENLLLEEILVHLRQTSYAHIPGIAIYYRIYEMLAEPRQDEHYLELKRLLQQHSLEFAPSEARDMYAFALNHCIRRINQGQSEYLREILDLYREGLEQEFLLENGQLSPWDYKNIVVVGLRRKEFAWTGDFIHRYRDRVPESYRENAFTYNLAKFHFYQKEYSQVLRLLQQVEYEDVFYNLDSKVMLLKIYFELGEVEALDSLIDAFRIFLRRNKLISAHHRRNYLNLTRFVKKLSRMPPEDPAGMQKIRMEVEATEQVADIDWLRAKLNGKS